MMKKSKIHYFFILKNIYPTKSTAFDLKKNLSEAPKTFGKPQLVMNISVLFVI